jgi:hypothetical protein
VRLLPEPCCHCYDLTSRQVLISRHVVFDESDFPFSSSTPTPDPDIEPCFLTRWCSRLFLFFLFQQILLVHHRL